MKTVFKIGMKVYDSVFFPKSEGEVVNIKKHIDGDKVIVQFDCIDYDLQYSEEGRLSSTRYESSPTLSTSPYTFQGFEQKEPVPTFEEAWEWIGKNPKERHSYEEDLYFKTEALKKLIVLRDYYNNGWQPNWKKEREMKYVIYNDSNRLATIQSYNTSYILAFKDGIIRNKFLKDQKELLEIAKTLL